MTDPTDVGPAQQSVPPEADLNFESRLSWGIRPIAEHFLAMCLYHLFETGLYDELASHPGITLDELAESGNFQRDRLEALLLYLANEGLVVVDNDQIRLAQRGVAYNEFRHWYTFLIGGYASTVAQIGEALAEGAPFCTRDGEKVAVGSCEISRFDGMPMTLDLLQQGGVEASVLLDLGCGDALYTVEFCKTQPQLSAWGVEPDRPGYEQAQKRVGSAGLSDRIRVVHASATEFVAKPPAGCSPDLVVFGYVLQEVLAQESRAAVVEMLVGIVEQFPEISIVVIEVADKRADPRVMQHSLARNFWNPYFLMHGFTNQRLESSDFWVDVFGDAGLEIIARNTTDLRVDSTGIELGYLLRRAESSGQASGR